MEPFTMVIYDFGELFELRWDGALPYVKQLDMNKRHIWSSATLYDKTVTEKREKWFADWLEQRTDFSLEAILGFHQNAGDGDPENDVIMNRKGLVQTVSITQIVKQSNQVEMIYRDLLNIKEKNAKILLKGEVVGSR
jgi:putative lipoic acid-binding regulatory protein